MKIDFLRTLFYLKNNFSEDFNQNDITTYK